MLKNYKCYKIRTRKIMFILHCSSPTHLSSRNQRIQYPIYLFMFLFHLRKISFSSLVILSSPSNTIQSSSSLSSLICFLVIEGFLFDCETLENHYFYISSRVIWFFILGGFYKGMKSKECFLFVPKWAPSKRFMVGINPKQNLKLSFLICEKMGTNKPNLKSPSPYQLKSKPHPNSKLA